MLRRPSIVALVALSLTLAACGATGGDAGETTVVVGAPVATIAGVGVLPDTVPANREPLVMVPPPVNDDGTTAELVGDIVAGNRILIIGDSIMASTSSRYGGQMCDALVPLGWEAAVEAEPSRFIDFGNRVLDKVLVRDPPPGDDWNAAVVFLGSNYGGDEARYEAELRMILERLSPRPTLLFTVTEYRANYSEVNNVVRRLGSEYDNVTVIDWQGIAETPGVLSSDRLHPTEMGREVLAQAVAGALGPVSIGDGACLKPVFRNDSAINRGTGGGSSVGGSTGTRTTTTTTVRPTTTTSVAGSGSGGVVTTTTVQGGGGTAGGTTTAPTTAPTTQPSTTATTQPPTTQPATTPPTTPPPTTPPPVAPLDPPPGG
ncbi:MAG TPA: hypothetical protein VES40_15275 [Ilumatobacteraceae bacterium]|nr:hypothetical protein [Ilumatobacteraceae bacterium]